MATRKAGSVVLSFRAGTGEFDADISKINATVNNFAGNAERAGKRSAAGFVANTASARIMGGNLNLNTRAMAKFMDLCMGMGPIMQAAFPVIGLVMVGTGAG